MMIEVDKFSRRLVCSVHVTYFLDYFAPVFSPRPRLGHAYSTSLKFEVQ